MATVTFTKLFGAKSTFAGVFDISELTLPKSNQDSKTAEYVDKDGGEHISLHGSGLKYSNGHITAGTIDKIVFENDDGKAMVVVDDLKLSAKELGTLLDPKKQDFLVPFTDAVFSGNDTITGSDNADNIFGGMGNDHISGGRGGDTIFGGKGDDRLRGGFGSDTFQFGQFCDKDTISDFDANGGGNAQDHLQFSNAFKSVKQSGDDLVIDFGGGDTLTLLGVDKHDFTKADYTI